MWESKLNYEIMNNPLKRKRGAPQGNQNARKHGFYSKVISGKNKRDLAQAIDVVGIDEEIALLRARIRSVLEHDPDNINLIMQATCTLARLLRTRHYLGADNHNKLRQAIGNVLTDIGLPLGIDIMKITDPPS